MHHFFLPASIPHLHIQFLEFSHLLTLHDLRTLSQSVNQSIKRDLEIENPRRRAKGILSANQSTSQIGNEKTSLLSLPPIHLRCRIYPVDRKDPKREGMKRRGS